MEAQAPLHGITVLDMTANIAGPFATLTLQELGARVIKVEPPNGDSARHWSPRDENSSAVFAAFNRGKESVQIDAKQPEGQKLIRQLAARSDVFVESFRPGKAERINLGFDQLKQDNPGLVYCSLNAFGEAGPLAGMPGFDAIIQAYTGLMELTGEADGPPSRSGAAVVDVGSGLWAALGVVGALMQRREDGRGRRVVTTLLGTSVAYLMHHMVATLQTGVAPRRIGTAQHNFAPYEAVRTSTRMVMVGVNTEEMWRRFCSGIGTPDLAGDSRFADNASRVARRGELVSTVEVTTTTMTAAQLVDALSAAGVPAAEVRGVADLVEDRQLDSIGLWGECVDGRRYPQIPLSGAPTVVGPVPALGAHTASVLAEFGASTEQIAEQVASGVIPMPSLLGAEPAGQGGVGRR